CTAAEIEPPAALDFGEFPLANGFEFGFLDTRHPNNVVIANNERCAAVRDCSHGQLRLRRNADLAHQDQVEASIQRSRYLRGHGYTAAQQRENHGFLILVSQQRLRKLAASIGSIGKGHVALPAIQCEHVRTDQSLSLGARSTGIRPTSSPGLTRRSSRSLLARAGTGMVPLGRRTESGRSSSERAPTPVTPFGLHIPALLWKGINAVLANCTLSAGKRTAAGYRCDRLLSSRAIAGRPSVVSLEPWQPFLPRCVSNRVASRPLGRLGRGRTGGQSL